jgi:carboxyl-terminal processing protease
MLFITGIVFIGIFAGFILLDDDKVYLKINKSIELFGRVYREVTLNYVDDLDPDKFMQAGIEGMLSTLDPYTIYIDEKKNDDIDLIQTGKYGGIGITVGMRDGNIIIVSLMEGYSAQKKGLMPGDKLLEIDGKKIQGMRVDDVKQFVRGEPGTDVKIKIEREGEKEPIEFVLQREEIQVKNVTYSGIVGDKVGYIRLERFSRTAGEEVRKAIKSLKSQENLSGIILDLRNNPGGLLEAAVDVTKKFVSKNSIIVSTKGRKADSEKKYISDEEPIATDISLVVLVNNQSASASEIVAGAIQDLDRGLIVGNKTFGKGLVQSIVNLSYNSSLKVTTAKYYTPSGRCIQKIDYMHKGKDGLFLIIPDSLKKHFKTINGRDVTEAGGILPDSVVIIDSTSDYTSELIRKAMFFKFAVQFAITHKELEKDFKVTDNLISDFEKFLKSKNFEYKDESEKKMEELWKIAKSKDYSVAFMGHLKEMEKQIKVEKENEFVRNKDEIKYNLEFEIVGNLKGQTEQIAYSVNYDKQVLTAIKLLNNKKLYSKILNIKK